MTGKAAFSVSEITNLISAAISDTPVFSSVSIRGELSNYKVYPSGHHYFTLKDKDASIRCVMFRSYARFRFRPENGMGVICTGDVRVYARDGAYQLYVMRMEPTGLGDLYLAFEQLKARLLQEGLFDQERKKSLPVRPERIAIVTSPAGAAVRDMIRILGERWPLSKVIVLPVRVQGDEAPGEIASAIEFANRHKTADLIITGRGGGSMEDLWAFNTEIVARAIEKSVIPVISAVGHEPDYTISDFVADMRASTPSNAAEIAVPHRADILQLLQGMHRRMDSAVKARVMTAQRAVAELSSRPVMRDPMFTVHLKQQELDHMQERLGASFRMELQKKKYQFIRLTASMDAMSPMKVLSRGFALAETLEGRPIADAKQVGVGENVIVRLAHGRLNCSVREKMEEIS